MHYKCTQSKELKMPDTAENEVLETIKLKAIFMLMVYFVHDVISAT